MGNTDCSSSDFFKIIPEMEEETGIGTRCLPHVLPTYLGVSELETVYKFKNTDVEEDWEVTIYDTADAGELSSVCAESKSVGVVEPRIFSYLPCVKRIEDNREWVVDPCDDIEKGPAIPAGIDQPYLFTPAFVPMPAIPGMTSPKTPGSEDPDTEPTVADITLNVTIVSAGTKKEAPDVDLCEGTSSSSFTDNLDVLVEYKLNDKVTTAAGEKNSGKTLKIPKDAKVSLTIEAEKPGSTTSALNILYSGYDTKGTSTNKLTAKDNKWSDKGGFRSPFSYRVNVVDSEKSMLARITATVEITWEKEDADGKKKKTTIKKAKDDLTLSCKPTDVTAVYEMAVSFKEFDKDTDASDKDAKTPREGCPIEGSEVTADPNKLKAVVTITAIKDENDYFAAVAFDNETISTHQLTVTAPSGGPLIRLVDDKGKGYGDYVDELTAVIDIKKLPKDATPYKVELAFEYATTDLPKSSTISAQAELSTGAVGNTLMDGNEITVKCSEKECPIPLNEQLTGECGLVAEDGTSVKTIEKKVPYYVKLSVSRSVELDKYEKSCSDQEYVNSLLFYVLECEGDLKVSTDGGTTYGKRIESSYTEFAIPAMGHTSNYNPEIMLDADNGTDSLLDGCLKITLNLSQGGTIYELCSTKVCASPTGCCSQLPENVSVKITGLGGDTVSSVECCGEDAETPPISFSVKPIVELPDSDDPCNTSISVSSATLTATSKDGAYIALCDSDDGCDAEDATTKTLKLDKDLSAAYLVVDPKFTQGKAKQTREVDVTLTCTFTCNDGSSTEKTIEKTASQTITLKCKGTDDCQQKELPQVAIKLREQGTNTAAKTTRESCGEGAVDACFDILIPKMFEVADSDACKDMLTKATLSAETTDGIEIAFCPPGASCPTEEEGEIDITGALKKGGDYTTPLTYTCPFTQGENTQKGTIKLSVKAKFETDEGIITKNANATVTVKCKGTDDPDEDPDDPGEDETLCNYLQTAIEGSGPITVASSTSTGKCLTIGLNCAGLETMINNGDGNVTASCAGDGLTLNADATMTCSSLLKMIDSGGNVTASCTSEGKLALNADATVDCASLEEMINGGSGNVSASCSNGKLTLTAPAATPAINIIAGEGITVEPIEDSNGAVTGYTISLAYKIADCSSDTETT